MSEGNGHVSKSAADKLEYGNQTADKPSSIDQEWIPRTYAEAMEDDEWRESVNDEMGAMERNNTWYETELPKGKKAVTSRLIHTIKYLANGKPERKKTRLVARGYTQVYGEDYLDTFAPVAKLHTIRIILSLAVNQEWDRSPPCHNQ